MEEEFQPQNPVAGMILYLALALRRSKVDPHPLRRTICMVVVLVLKLALMNGSGVVVVMVLDEPTDGDHVGGLVDFENL
jgi:hypothetical protein